MCELCHGVLLIRFSLRDQKISVGEGITIPAFGVVGVGIWTCFYVPFWTEEVTSSERFATVRTRQGRPVWAEKNPLNLNQVMLAEEVERGFSGTLPGERSFPPPEEAK